MNVIKEFGLLLYLMPLWGVLFILDICMKVCKAGYKPTSLYDKFRVFGYKKFHIAGEHVSRHVTKVMDKNNL